MSGLQRKRKKRKRTVPRNIGEKTGREIAEAVFGKRAMKEIDRVTAEANLTTDESST